MTIEESIDVWKQDERFRPTELEGRIVALEKAASYLLFNANYLQLRESLATRDRAIRIR